MGTSQIVALANEKSIKPCLPPAPLRLRSQTNRQFGMHPVIFALEQYFFAKKQVFLFSNAASLRHGNIQTRKQGLRHF